MLIEGNDPAALQLHWGNFENLEKRIQEEGKRFEEGSADPRTKGLMEKFLAAHLAMGDAYRKGLQAFRKSGSASDLSASPGWPERTTTLSGRGLRNR